MFLSSVFQQADPDKYVVISAILFTEPLSQLKHKSSFLSLRYMKLVIRILAFKYPVASGVQLSAKKEASLQKMGAQNLLKFSPN